MMGWPFLAKKNFGKKNVDLLAVGDLANDVYLRLTEAELNCQINTEHCRICFGFGDKIPYESATFLPAVGNAINSAVGARRLGLKVAVLTNIGQDEQGQLARQALNEQAIDTSLVFSHPNKATNFHYVLWFKDDRTILVNHQAYDYRLPDIGYPRWLYLSSLGENSLEFQTALMEQLRQKPDIKLAFQPGTFQIRAGYSTLQAVYQRSEIIICNQEEARKILRDNSSATPDLLSKLRRLGPTIAIITNGRHGAYAQNEQTTWQIPIYPETRPVIERTGAGDAFASAIISALALGLPLEQALLWGPINAASVIQHIGTRAGLLSRQEIEKRISEGKISLRRG